MSENKPPKKYARHLQAPDNFIPPTCQNCVRFNGVYSLECYECSEFYPSQFSPRKDFDIERIAELFANSDIF